MNEMFTLFRGLLSYQDGTDSLGVLSPSFVAYCTLTESVSANWYLLSC